MRIKRIEGPDEPDRGAADRCVRLDQAAGGFSGYGRRDPRRPRSPWGSPGSSADGRNRGSLTRCRNGSRPIFPAPIPACRSTRLPRSRQAVVQVPDPQPAQAHGPVQSLDRFIVPFRADPGNSPPRKCGRCPRKRPAARVRARVRGSPARCSNRWPRHVPWPAVVSRSIVTPRPAGLTVDLVERRGHAPRPASSPAPMWAPGWTTRSAIPSRWHRSHFHDHGVDRLVPERVVGAGQVDQVRGVGHGVARCPSRRAPGGRRRRAPSVKCGAFHWLLFLVKSCTVWKPTAWAAATARSQPPAIDMWAPNLHERRLRQAGRLCELWPWWASVLPLSATACSQISAKPSLANRRQADPRMNCPLADPGTRPGVRTWVG